MTPDILEIPEVRRRVSPLSVEEYHRLGEFNENWRRTELIRGIVIEKMSKSPRHRIITSRLYRRLLRSLPDGFCVWKEEPLTFVDSEPEPDISVTRGTEDDYARAHPTSAELVIEVAVSSPELDRANASLYAEAGINEYWIILAVERRVEIYRRPSKGVYDEISSLGPGDTIECKSIPGVRMPVSDFLD